MCRHLRNGKDGKPEEDPKGPKEDDEEEEKQNEGGVMKRLLSAIAKMVGINPGELNSAIEEIEKGNSESFKEKMAQRKAQKIADEIWDFCYALQSSLCAYMGGLQFGNSYYRAGARKP